MANPIHQWIDAVTTRVEDQRRTIERLDKALLANDAHTTDLRESVARLQIQNEATDRLFQLQLKVMDDRISGYQRLLEEQRRDARRATAKTFTLATGVVTTLGGVISYFLGN